MLKSAYLEEEGQAPDYYEMLNWSFSGFFVNSERARNLFFLKKDIYLIISN